MTGIFDSHLHVIDLGRFRYPWLASVERLRRDFPYSAYALEARRCGISDALHMEVDVDPAQIEDETAMAAALASEPNSLLRGAISSCRPENSGFPAFLERQRANPFVKGFRRILHEAPDAVSEGARFRENIRLLSGSGLPFDLVVRPDQIPKAIALVDLSPNVQFVLDHCGVPNVKDEELHPWREHIGEIAKRPNVAAKISGVSAYADASSWTADDLRPYVEHVITSFGWQRVVWGSDWPVVTLGSSLSTWVAATHYLIAGTSGAEKAALLSENARRIWRIE